MEVRKLIKVWMKWKNKNSDTPYYFKDLARDSGIVSTYLSNIMTGARNPGLRTVERIADAFGMNISEFYSGPGDMSISESSSDKKISENIIGEQPEYFSKTDSGKKEIKSGSISPAQELALSEKFGLKISNNNSDELSTLFDVFIQTPDIKTSPNDSSNNEPAAVDSSSAALNPAAFTARAPLIPVLEYSMPGNYTEWNMKITGLKTIPRFYGIEGKNVFAIIIKDESMVPVIYPEDVLIVDPSKPFVNFDGGIGIAVVENLFLVRRIFTIDEKVELVSLNDEYENKMYLKNSIPFFKISLWIPNLDKRIF